MVMPRLTANRVLVPLTLLIFSIGIACSPLSYNTLDEVILRSLLQGSFLGYDGVDPLHTLYPNILFSRAVALLYSLAPGMYWYDIVIFCCNLLAQGVLLYTVLDGLEAVGSRLYRALTACLICYPLFVNPQFTLTAGLLGISALVLALYSVMQDRIRPAALLYVFFALILCGLIRYPVIHLVLLAGALVFLPAIPGLLRRRRAAAVVMVLPVLLALAASYGMQHLDRAHYRANPQLNDSLRLGAASRSVRNYAVTRPGEEILSQVTDRLSRMGIAPSTYFALRSAYYFDSDLAEPVAAESIAKEISPLLSRRGNLAHSTWEFLTHFHYRVRGLLADPLNQLFRLPADNKLESTRIVIFLLFLLLLGLSLGIRRHGSILVYGCLATATIYTAIAILLRIPPFRVYYLLFLVLAFFLLVARKQDSTPIRKSAPWRRLVAGMALVALGINQVQAYVQSGQQNTRQHQRIRAVVEQFDRSHVYLLETDFLNHYMLPFRPDPASDNLRAFTGGWHSVLPWYREMLSAYGTGGEIESFCDNAHLRLVPAVRRSFRDGQLVRYLRVSALERDHQVVRHDKSARANGHPVYTCELQDAP